ncbi:transglutaminase domain-containing protein [Enorma sp.]|uniref:transglutaminase domain-containing protein n=1 Tax=Enorma sp. TaxID=1920692 RepID=UPI003AB70F13
MATYEFSSDSIKNMLGRFAKAADGAVKGAREALREDAEQERVSERARREEERAALAWRCREEPAATRTTAAKRIVESSPVVPMPAHVKAKLVETKPPARAATTAPSQPAAHTMTTASNQPGHRGQRAPLHPAPSLESMVKTACAFERERLNEAARRAYDELRKGMFGYQERIEVLGATGEELQDAYEALRYGAPEALWLDGFSRRRSAISALNWDVFPVYRISKDETARLLQEMADRSEPLLAALRALPSDEQRVQAAHNALILNCDYSDSDDPAEATAAGALVNGKALCLGISLAFKYLMDRLDIPCVVMRGNANGSGKMEEAGPHAWNLVQVKGGWSHVDVTYDLSGSTDKRRPFLTYLGLSDAQLASTHTWDTDRYPAATRSFDCYRRKGRFVCSWDELAGLLDLTLARDRFCAFQLDERLAHTGATGERVLSAEELRRKIFDLAGASLTGVMAGKTQLSVTGSNALHVYHVAVA